MANAKDGAMSVLSNLDPVRQHVAFGVLGPSQTATSCGGANSPANGLPASAAQYGDVYPARCAEVDPVGLTGSGAPVNQQYLNVDGTLDAEQHDRQGDHLHDDVEHRHEPVDADQDGPPVPRGEWPARVAKGIIFETDGSPNFNSAGNAADYTCAAAVSQAATAKAAGIEMFTIGFGIGATDVCPDTSGTYYNRSVTFALADMATTSVDDGCVAAENSDGDHFFCQPRSQDLESVFVSAVSALTGTTKLVKLPG